MMTPEQSRAARGLLKLKPEDIAERAGISAPTIRSFENEARATMPADVRVLRMTFETLGVVFVDADAPAGPSVRLRQEVRV